MTSTTLATPRPAVAVLQSSGVPVLSLDDIQGIISAASLVQEDSIPDDVLDGGADKEVDSNNIEVEIQDG
jgi:hypothetical protein